MEPGPTGTNITELLRRAQGGEQAALDQLMPVIYRELKKLAAAHLRREQNPPETTELVHETFLRLSGGKTPSFESRAHYFGIASRLMRQVLVDASRARHAEKRSGIEVALADAESLAVRGPGGFLAIHEALERLEAEDETKARLVEMRFFGGMTAEESAVALNLPVNVVRQQLRLAQAWLRRELSA